MRLSNKFALMVIPLIALPLLIVGILAYMELWSTSEQHSRAQVKNHLQQLASDFQGQVNTAQFALKTLANDPLLQDYLLTDDQTVRYGLLQRPLLQKLASIQAANPDFYEVRLLRRNGFEELRRVNRAITNTLENEADSAFFSQLRQRQQSRQDSPDDHFEFIGNNPDNRTLALFVSLPVYLSDSTDRASDPILRGYLSITQSMDSVIALTLPSPWQSNLVMISDARTPQKVPMVSDHPLSNLHVQLTALHAQPSNKWHDVSFNGKSLQHFSIPLTADLQIHTLIPQQTLMQTSRKVGAILLIITGLALIIAIPVLLWLLRSQVLSPIATLNRALDGLAEGQGRIQLPKGGDDEIGDLVGAFNHMSLELYESNERIRSLAFLDSLTGLPNRVLFRRNLNRAMAGAERDGTLLALLFIDLDNFKHVNDTLGHPIGDKMLQQIAHRLQHHLRADDLAGRVDSGNLDANFSRLGGDEFTILIPNLEDAYQARIVAERIIAAIAEPIAIEHHQLYVGASIGIAIWPNDADSAEQLITHADQAMYQAKHQGKNNVHYYSQAIGEQTHQRARIEQRLHRAEIRGDMTLFYQPVVDSRTHEILSFEALVRWNDAELGAVTPDRFIPIAEESNLILPIGEWIIHDACKQLRKWHNEGFSQIRVGINLSVVQLSQPAIVDVIQQALLKYQLPSQSIYVELTETAIIKGEQQVLQNLQALRKMGIQIALDDFGTGYSSLSYLQNLPIDILKIDQGFIKNMDQGSNCIILSAIITMAHALGLKVIAEGVEDLSHLQFLATEEGVMIQGFLFSPPRSPEEAIDLMLQGFAQSPTRQYQLTD